MTTTYYIAKHIFAPFVSTFAQTRETWRNCAHLSLLVVGDGLETDVIVHGGRFDFDTANENLLTGMLPSLVHAAADTSFLANTFPHADESS